MKRLALRSPLSGLLLLCGWLIASQAGCFNPGLTSTAFSCRVDTRCPAGFFCGDDGCCHRQGSPDNTFDCLASPPDAGPDLPIDQSDGPPADEPLPDLPIDSPDLIGPDEGPDGRDGSDQRPECLVPGEDCQPTNNECLLAACDDEGRCTTLPVEDNTPTVAQTSGDCKRRVCNGAGGTRETVDQTDVENDQQTCTMDSCDTTGMPVHAPVGAGMACTESQGRVCDGSGHCVECNNDTHCNPPTTICDTANHICVTAQCLNEQFDGDETDLDCGGPDCGRCVNGKICALPRDCQSGFCSSAVCAACTQDTECAAAQHCSGGVCVADLAVGDGCQRDAQCPGDRCVDNFCCNVACAGTCMACSAGLTGGTSGTCAPVSDGQNPGNECGAQVCVGGACGCTLDSHCSGATPHCDTAENDCVCIAARCDDPPADSCADVTHALIHPATGTCGGSGCTYTPVNTLCPNGCFQGVCNVDAPTFVGDATAVEQGTATVVVLARTPDLDASTGGTVAANQAVEVRVRVTPHQSVQQLVLNFTVNDFGSTTPVTMTFDMAQGTDDVYRAVIPGQAAGLTVRFFVQLTPHTGAPLVSPGSNTNFTYKTAP